MVDEAASRRGFLKLSAGAGAASAALSPVIANALSLPARRATGTIKDVEHVVILMQENRSFDHYFGTLRGVRGFGDPRPINLPGGAPVWLQPTKDDQDVVAPFHLDSSATRAQSIQSLDHSWKGAHARWKNYDGWVKAKGQMTMGYFTRADIPFYHALADAFTVCDGYHCSIFAPTNPNRLFLFTGTSGLSAGDTTSIVVANSPIEVNETADPLNDTRSFNGLAWPTYAERLEDAGVSWKVYQEHDNFGDNGLAYFANFRGVGPDHVLYQKGRAWAPGSTAENAKESNGEHLIAQFAADAAADKLPQVSWIVPPYKLCEHPTASPAEGEYFTARLLDALTANPEVWAKTVLILNYDENDGFFDHVPPALPATGSAAGKSTVDTAGELYRGEPVGLGPRVPMMVISPWSKGGYVNSQVMDHTSVIRFLEARFGVAEPHITPWRRAVTGDLTSAFDFSKRGGAPVPALPDASRQPAKVIAAKGLPSPTPIKGVRPAPRQEAGVRPARALPYAFDVAARAKPDGLALRIANTGAAGAAFNLYIAGQEPRFYTVEAGKALDDAAPTPAGAYAASLHGPNGFLRTFRGAAPAGPEADARFDPRSGQLTVSLRNDGPRPATLVVTPTLYSGDAPRRLRLAPGETRASVWDVRSSGHWYDLTVTCRQDPDFERRIAGHGEDGRPSISDPALGRQA